MFDGAPGSGKTAQLNRLRMSQRSVGLFAGDPLFLELPRDMGSSEARAQRARALAAREEGRAVFVERWHPADPPPDITLLSPVSFTEPGLSTALPVGPRPGLVVAEPGFESQVTLQLFDALVRLGLMAGCPCGVAA